MSNNKNYVTVGKPKIGGSIYVAPVGTPLPTDAVTALNDQFNCLGYVSDEGVANNNSPETEVVKAWGGDVVMKTVNSKNDTWQYTLIQAMELEVLKFVYGADNVSGTLATGITVKANAKAQPAVSVVIEMIYNSTTLKRVVLPEAFVSNVAEIKYVDNSPVGYNTTLTCLADDEGNTHYEYIKESAS